MGHEGNWLLAAYGALGLTPRGNQLSYNNTAGVTFISGSTTPAAPAANTLRLFGRNGTLVLQDETGAETEYSSGGGGGGGDATLAGTQTFTGAKTFSNASSVFNGNGAGLLALNATQLTSGTIPNARISALPNANLQNSGLTITAGTGLSGGGLTALGGSCTLTLTNTAVTAASYTNANITVDAQGRITAASNGSSSGGLDPAADNTFTGINTFDGNVYLYGSNSELILDGEAHLLYDIDGVEIFDFAAKATTVIADVTTGDVQDSEIRDAFNNLLAILRDYKLIPV